MPAVAHSELRPRIAVIGRFAKQTSALRYRALVNARALLEAVWAAGGDPVTLLPVAGADWAKRLEGFGGVLMPGGGDIDPARFGLLERAENVYDVDELQDAADFDCAEYALEAGIPLLAICRGLHVVNAVRGGTLVQDLTVHHRHFVHDVTIDRRFELFGLSASVAIASCYHHQGIDVAGEGVDIVARAADGVPEAAVIDGPGWAVGVQWHPEDTAATDPEQAALFEELVRRAGARS
jgi:putative glutamine amidotransferase